MTIEQLGNSVYTGVAGDDKNTILNPNSNALFFERDTGVIYRFNFGWVVVNTSGSSGGGSGTGSINTASNVGATGEGWFKQINLDDLQFKKAKAGSNVISLASSADNVTIDVVQSNLNLGLMGGVASESSLPIASETLKGIVELSKNDGTENTGIRVIQDNDPRLTNSRTPLVHTHVGTDVNSGLIPAAQLPAATTTVKGAVILSTDNEATAGEVVTATDTRLSNARTPLAHVHDGVDITTGTVNNARLTDSSTSTKGIVQLATSAQNTAGLAVQASDTRLSDSRVPTLHATTHKTGGSDVIKLDELGAPTDITTLNFSSTAHGLAPKHPNDATQVLRGDGTYGQMAPFSASYLTLATNTVLTNERVLTAGTNTSFVDAGAGSTLTINVPDATTLVKGAVELATDNENAANVVVQGNDTRLSNARTPTAHVHDGGDITTGTVNNARLTDASTSTKGISQLATSVQVTAGLVVQASDTRLSDSRNPLAHNHSGSEITSGTVIAARLPDATEIAKGIVELATNIETTAGLVVQANDSRLSDSRTPISHVHSGADITSGTIGVSVLPTASTSAKGISQLATSAQTTAGLVVQASDTRLSDPRTPTTHSHGNADITDLAYSKLTGVPSTFTPSAHNHSATEITSGTLAVAQGGTNKNTITQHALLKGGASNTYSEITAGTEGHVLKVVSGTPAWAAETGGGGTLTGVSNVGTGDGTVYRDTTSGTVNLKSIKAGTNVTVTNNADDITISSVGSGGGSMTATSLGTGEGTVYKETSGSEFRFRSLNQGTNITISQDANEITIDAATVPDGSETVKGIVELSKADGTESAGTRVIQDNDPRLTNSRTPTSHVHSGADITSGTVPIAQLPVASETAKGISELATSIETTAGLVVQANDTRLSDARTPTAHSHGDATITDLAYSKLTSVPSSFTPSTHASTHKSGGTDVIKLDELAAPTDVTTLNVSSTAHGLTPKHPNDVTQVLRGDGTYGAMAPFSASYLTLATNTVLTNERVLTQGTNISLVDGGAGSTLTINVPDASTSVKGAVQLGISSDTTANLAVQTNDTRLTNSRTPTSHKDTHKVGGGDAFVKGDDLNAAGKYLEDIVDPASDGQRIWIEDATANIKYWSDEASPVKHVIERQANKGAASGYASLDSSTLVPVAQLPAATTSTKGAVQLGTSSDTTANLAVQTDDTRLTNSRTPTTHASSHMSAGGDPIRIDELKIGTDVTTLNSTTTEHGLLKKLSNSATQYMDGTGNWSTPPGTGAPITAQYLTLATDATLTVERVLTSGTNTSFIDGGAGSTLTVNVPDGSTTVKGAVELATSGENAANVVVQGNDSRLSDARTPLSHNHAASEITSGTLAVAQGGTNKSTITQHALLKGGATNSYTEIAPDTDGKVLKMVSGTPAWASETTSAPVSAQYLTLATDSTLTVERVLTSGTNINFVDGGAGSTLTVNVPDGTTGTKGAVQLASSVQTTSGLVVQASDTRLSDSRNPLTHVHSGADITSGTVPITQLPTATTAAKGIIQLGTSSDTTANLVVQTDDTRLTNSRTPSAHKDTHKVGGGDPFAKGDDLNASARYLEDIADMASDPQRIWIEDATANLKYWSDEGSPVKHVVERQANKGAASGYASLNSSTKVPIIELPDATTTTKGIFEIATSGENSSTVVVAGNDSRLSDARTPTAHNHSGAEITSGTVPIAQLPTATESAKGISELATSAETTAGLVIQANDTRLSDSRAPTAHNHNTSDINAGTLGVVRGGTGVATVTSNALLKGAGTSALTEIIAGTNTHVLTMVAGVPAWAAPAAGGGEANTTSNSGTGTGTLALAKSGVDLPFKTLKQGTNIALTNNASDVTIDIGSGVTTNTGVQTLTNKTIQGLDLNVNPKTATYTATTTDDFIPCAPAANMTINLPAASTSSGFIYRIQKTNSNAFTVTIDANASELINGATTLVITSQYQGYVVWCDGTTWYTTVGTSERVGTATGTANGSNTVFNIAHGLGSTPYRAHIQCSSHSNSFTYTTDATNIVVTFGTAPSSSPSTATFHWSAVI